MYIFICITIYIHKHTEEPIIKHSDKKSCKTYLIAVFAACDGCLALHESQINPFAATLFALFWG